MKYDNFEMHPCHRVNDPEYERKEGKFVVEQCAEHEAEFWTVYGHLPTGGVDAIQDFQTQEEAMKALDEHLVQLNTFTVVSVYHDNKQVRIDDIVINDFLNREPAELADEAMEKALKSIAADNHLTLSEQESPEDNESVRFLVVFRGKPDSPWMSDYYED